MEKLQDDLSQLVKWNNLVARQEVGRSRTIEDFQKKRYRYQCTPYTVAIERLLLMMEQQGDVFGGSLEKKEFDRLNTTLIDLKKAINQDTLPSASVCYDLWKTLFTHFRLITKNTSDYMAHISSEEAEERMKTTEFLIFKDLFTTYLRDFILGLQQAAYRIQINLKQITITELDPLIQQVIIHHNSIPRFEKTHITDKDKLTQEKDKWLSLVSWFLGDEQTQSELIMLENRTNDQIRRITRTVQRLGERNAYFRGQKKDFLELSTWFDSMETIEEAHHLSAAVFGLIHTRHLFSDDIPSDDIYTSVWEEEPITYYLKNRTKRTGRRTKPDAIVSNQAAKEKTRQAYLRKQQREQDILESYMRQDQIILGDLPVIEPHVRKTFLNWFQKAMHHKDRIFKTEYGHTVQAVININGLITLRSEDGTLEMPDVTFHILKREVL